MGYQEPDDFYDYSEEQTGQNKPMSALLVWVAIILVALGVIFLFIPLKVQFVIQRLKDQKYILGKKK